MSEVSDDSVERQRLRVERRDLKLRTWGLRSWWFVGIAAAAAILAGAIGAVSGLVVPLVVAVVVGMLFVPSVDFLDRYMPRALAAAIVLTALVGVAVAAIAVSVAGVVGQADEIAAQLEAGSDQLIEWAEELDLEVGGSGQLVDGLADVWDFAISGVVGLAGTVFSTATAFLAGSFVGVFMLYFILADWNRLANWVGDHLGVSSEVGRGIVDDATWSMRQYFAALTVASVVVAVMVGLTAAILGVPLAFTIAMVTMLTAYIPYLGALFSGAFAVLIALGSGGFEDALIMLLVILVAQNVVQTIVQTKMSEGRLSLHPIVIFGSTIAGGATLGLLGAALSTPVVALCVTVQRRLAKLERE
ncbi:putative PurR-regulated permease PerM [Ilumatobacter fluminis]|uniref:Putative PurR-regulated permease PerM n=1 Tax=Ilumatobacter fluminis TaxID=467091 RepID=A0A4R7HXH0_9ACTN|nr:AI-2E family transporter [Ilumatobacter fluminis]TDT15887.1 putative PurR-regulated permease PerM [Ilumatobacter fluminis]